MWVLLALCSALLLGIYDVFKKRSLKENAVIPVLASSIFISAVIFTPFLLLSTFAPQVMEGSYFYVPKMDFSTHLRIFLKSAIVLGSWISAYFGMKYVPITIFSPIRATQPMWTVIGAFFIFSEHLTPLQAVGVVVTIFFFYCFSLAGLKEGISWKKNKWIWLIILATLLGAASGLYDKHLMRSFDRVGVQVFSTMYQALLMLIILLTLWYPNRKKTTPFEWRWTIAGISIFLIFADYVYFWALSSEDALISIVSTIRRSGAVVPFLYGALFLGEKNLKLKGVLLCGILCGVALLTVGALR